MGNTILEKFIASFGGKFDPRVVGRTAHSLLNIVVLSVCAVFCGADA